MDSDGTFKAVLVDTPTDAAILYNGLAYDSLNDQILFTYDHSTATFDAVKAISLYDGTVSTVISNNFLSGVLPGLARLTGGELLVLETTASAEKFLADNTRVGVTAPAFIATLTATVVDITPTLTGGFLTCSTGTTNTVRTYTVAGVLGATSTSASPTPTLGALPATSCIQDATGRIIVSYSSTPDYVRVYTDATMATIAWTFSDANVQSVPGKLAVRANGNILITDTTFNQIVEISSAGVLVGVIGGAVLASPNNILVVP